MTALEQIANIGVYGWTPETFIEALQSVGVDVLVDIRARRGMRGSEYAFANHKRLRNALDSAEIEYLHLRELAPTAEARAVQSRVDHENSTGKRDRRELSQAFRSAYQTQVLANISMAELIDTIARAGTKPVLLCVERNATACHRSMVSEAIVRATRDTPELDLEP